MGGILAAGSPWSAVHAGLFLTEGLYLLMLIVIFFAIQLVEDTTKRSGAVLGGGIFNLKYFSSSPKGEF
jgi:hypothetical protein